MSTTSLRGALLVALCELAACDARQAPAATAAVPSPAPIAPAPKAATTAPPQAVLLGAAMPSSDRFAARTRELANPDNATVVLLYLDLAGLKPSIDEWVEEDVRVRFAAPADKAARRSAVRAELEAAAAAVHDVGRIRISLANAELSDWDPSYGEFTVRALSPASELVFQAFGQKVTTRFANAQTAQLWRVPAGEAQAVRDKVAGRTVSLDAVLKIAGVQPGSAGGAIVTDIEQYALHASDGSTLARIP